MLKDASAAGTAAPASLSGTIPVAGEQAWVERRRRSFQDTTSLRSPNESTDSSDSPRQSDDAAPSVTYTKGVMRRSHTPEGVSGTHRQRSSTLSLNPSPARPLTAKEHLTVAAHGISSLQSVALSSTSPTVPSPGASRITVSRLLDQLTEIHDCQQKERIGEWDAFLKKRNKTRKGQETGFIGVSQMGLDGKAGQDEWRNFSRLVRSGIPLAYRSDVWTGKYRLFHRKLFVDVCS